MKPVRYKPEVSNLPVLIGLAAWILLSFAPNVRAQPSVRISSISDDIATASTHSESKRSGIREIIDVKYQKKYARWKREFLATDMGRRQWSSFAQHPFLLLTITVSPKQQNGAVTNRFKWRSGRLEEVTITLGDRIDHAFPSPIYYPVIAALGELSSSTRSDILAAAVMA